MRGCRGEMDGLRETADDSEQPPSTTLPTWIASEFVTSFGMIRDNAGQALTRVYVSRRCIVRHSSGFGRSFGAVSGCPAWDSRANRTLIFSARRSLQACISSSALQPSLMSKDILQVGPLQWGFSEANT